MPGLGFGGSDDGVGQFLALLGRQTRGTVHTAPIANDHVVAFLFEGRCIDTGNALRRADGEDAELAVPDVLTEFGITASDHLELAAERLSNDFTATAEGDVIHLVDRDIHFCRPVRRCRCDRSSPWSHRPR